MFVLYIMEFDHYIPLARAMQPLFGLDAHHHLLPISGVGAGRRKIKLG
jgi:hypothetical protein